MLSFVADNVLRLTGKFMLEDELPFSILQVINFFNYKHIKYFYILFILNNYFIYLIIYR